MPTISAKQIQRKKKPPVILFVVYPGFKLLDLAGPQQAFNDLLDASGNHAYTTVVVSATGSSTKSDTPVSITTESLDSWLRKRVDSIIAVGGSGVFEAQNDKHLLSRISRIAKKSRRIGSICSGAYLLAECGLLDKRRVVTHWEYCEDLAASYPSVRVKTDPIYVKDHNVWTSAGVTAGIDMAIAMIAEDFGRPAALSLARSLVTYFVRPGGQSQFSEALKLQSVDGTGRFDGLHKRIQENLNADLSVNQLANYVSMSPRNFARVYTSATGKTPAKAVEEFRVGAARRMLEEGISSLAVVAKRCGFSTDETMRRSFMRIIKTTPQDYRRQFRK